MAVCARNSIKASITLGRDSHRWQSEINKL
jgi:hypothetical protein